MKRFIGREDGLNGCHLPVRCDENMQEKTNEVLGPRRDTTLEILEEKDGFSFRHFFKIDQSIDLQRVMKETICNNQMEFHSMRDPWLYEIIVDIILAC